MTDQDAFIGFGANLGDPISQVHEALCRIFSVEGIEAVRVSSLYRTEPVGMKSNDWFVNGVAWIRTHLEPRELLKRLLEIEKEMGRVRTIPAAPRVIDLDLLLCGELVVDEAELHLPHPRLHQRRFVLMPLCEIAPHLRHPLLEKRICDLLRDLRDLQAVEYLGGFEEVSCGSVGRS